MESMIIRVLSESMIAKQSCSLLRCSDAVIEVGYNIIKLLIESKGDPDPDDLLALKHNLFIELLKGGQRTASKVGEPCEQALIGLSLLPSGKWKKAAYIRSYAYSGLWSFRGTFANWTRLQGSQYISPDASHLQSPGDEVLEALQVFEDDEASEEDDEENLDEDRIQVFNGNLSAFLDLDESEDANLGSLPAALDKYVLYRIKRKCTHSGFEIHEGQPEIHRSEGRSYTRWTTKACQLIAVYLLGVQAAFFLDLPLWHLFDLKRRC